MTSRGAAVLLAALMITLGAPATVATEAHDRLPEDPAEGLVADPTPMDAGTTDASITATTHELHLRADDEAFPDRRLAEQAPEDVEPHTDTVKLADDGSVAWTSAPLELPLTIEQGNVELWMSFTTTTPFLAANDFNAKLNLLLPDGNQTTIAEREDVKDPDTNENIFTNPLVPQQVDWRLAFSRTDIPAGAQLQLEVVSEGLLGQGAQGPATVYYDSTELDSLLTLEATVGEEPTIPVTDPALGEASYELLGTSGEMRTEAGESGLEPVPVAGDADTTPAVWESPPLHRDVQLERVVADLWLSSTTTTPLAATNFLDAQLFAIADGEQRLVAQRAPAADPDANANVFTVPAEPERVAWDLALHETQLGEGTQLRLAVTAETLPGLGPTVANLYTQGPAASELVLETTDTTLTLNETEVAVDEPVRLDGEILAGQAPWTYTWVFDDGNESGPFTTDQRTVTTDHSYESAGSYAPVLVVHDAEDRAGGALAELTVLPDGETEITITDVSANPSLPELGTLEITWTTDAPGDSTVRYGTSPDALDDEVTIDEAETEHAVRLDDLATATTYHYEVETENATSDVHEATTAGDFTGDSHTVVAFVDTGINPYHEAFQRAERTAHPATYIESFPASAEALQLDLDAPTYDDALANDSATFQAIGEDELAWIPGTNVVAAVDKGDATAANSQADETPILDDDGHGTAVAGTITEANPDVLLTVIEGIVDDGIAWAAQQPWIDVISVSSATVFPSAGQSVPEGFSQVLDNGKLITYAAGNAPNHDVAFPPSSYPQTISVGGAHPDVHGTEPLASKTPDVVSNFTVQAPTPTSKDEESSISGTSFAAPNAAGSLSAALLAVREAESYTADSTLDGLTTVPEDSPYADEGRLSNTELWDAMNRSATYWATSDWQPSFTVPVATQTPWMQMGWGFLGPSISPAIASTVTGDDVDSKPAEAHAWMALDRVVHDRYNTAPRDQAAGQARGASVPAPVYDAHPLEDPISTDHPYRNDADRTWTVGLEGADAVAVHFENLTIETGFDRVELETPDGATVATYSQSSGASFWSAPVPGDEAIIRLVSDGSLTRYGFDVFEIGTPTSAS